MTHPSPTATPTSPPLTADRRAWRSRSARLADPPAASGEFARQYRADVDFIAMLQGFRASGGLLRWSELGRWLERRQPGAARQLGQWHTRSALCELHWRSDVWVPACQFDPATGRLRSELRRVMQQLGLSPADPAFLRWLATPHAGYGQRSPADLLLNAAEDFEAAALADWGATWAAAA